MLRSLEGNRENEEYSDYKLNDGGIQVKRSLLLTREAVLLDELDSRFPDLTNVIDHF